MRSQLILAHAMCYVFAAFMLLGCSKRAESEIHLIPEGYTGPVVIIFGDSSAAPVRYEGESRVYEIPESGVVRTSSDVNEGVQLESVYFYVDENGARSEISQAYGSRQPEGVAVYDRTTGWNECSQDSERVVSQAYLVTEEDLPKKAGRARVFADSVICSPRSSNQR